MGFIQQIFNNDKFPMLLDFMPFLSYEDVQFIKKFMDDVNNEKWSEISLDRINQGKRILNKAFNK